MKTKCLILFPIACAMSVQGAPRSSANYSQAAESADSGGRRSSSTSYTNDGSAGLIAGVSTVSSPVGTAKAGYLGQLYEVTSLVVNASPPSVNELALCQLGAWQLLDDASHLDISASSVAWSVVTGPVTGISAAGLATAGSVYQNSSATVQGSFAGLTGLFNLTVLNLLPDNFGSYAGDGLDDSWQNQYFGLGNPSAGPTRDPDGDGQDNHFEFIAGIVPIDSNSKFAFRVESIAGQPARKRLVFSPRLNDRAYNIVTSSSLESSSWSALTGGVISDNGTERSVTDTGASQSLKFYRVQVSKP